MLRQNCSAPCPEHHHLHGALTPTRPTGDMASTSHSETFNPDVAAFLGGGGAQRSHDHGPPARSLPSRRLLVTRLRYGGTRGHEPPPQRSQLSSDGRCVLQAAPHANRRCSRPARRAHLAHPRVVPAPATSWRGAAPSWHPHLTTTA